MRLLDDRFLDLAIDELHDILRLRVDVFVVEQECAYPEIDGRDTEAATRHVRLIDDEGLAAYLRLLDDGDARRLGRIATRPSARGAGLAARLVDHAVATSSGPWVLDAQTHLEPWYRARGFAVVGDEYDDEGIPHVPMRRDR